MARNGRVVDTASMWAFPSYFPDTGGSIQQFAGKGSTLPGVRE